MNKDSNKDNHTMLAPSFANVGADAKFTLGDLSVTGYPECKWDPNMWSWAGGCVIGEFQLKVLKNDGSTKALYNWLDYKFGWSEEAPEVYEPGWYTTTDGETYTKISAEDAKKIEFNQGQAFWTIASGYKLVSAGQVTSKDLELVTNKDNHTPWGNGMPMDLTLGDLSVTGYPECKWDPNMWSWAGGCVIGEFQLKVLKNDGSTKALYNWLDYKFGWSEEAPEVYEPGWYTTTDGETYTKISPEDLAKITISAGEGFWILGSGYKLVVPAPEL